MKIPNNKVLAGLGLVGSLMTAWSVYWIGRRNELHQIIDLGREIEDEKNFRELNMIDDKGEPVSLCIRTEKK